MSSNVAIAILGAQQRALLCRGIDEGILNPGTLGQSRIERRMMDVAAACHFLDQCVVTCVQCGQFTLPPSGFWVSAVPAFPECENIPEPVQLAMLSEQVLPAENTRLQIPDSHRKLSMRRSTLDGSSAFSIRS